MAAHKHNLLLSKQQFLNPLAIGCETQQDLITDDDGWRGEATDDLG